MGLVSGAGGTISLYMQGEYIGMSYAISTMMWSLAYCLKVAHGN